MKNANIPSYGKIYNIGRKEVQDFFSEPYVAQEKVDGSQFSVRSEDGVLTFRSKNVIVNPEDAGLFQPTVDALRSLNTLADGLTYRGEALKSKKHNHLEYDRVPTHHFVVFDVEDASGYRLSPDDSRACAYAATLEHVQSYNMYAEDDEDGVAFWSKVVESLSSAYGATVEGVVLKSLTLLDRHTGYPLSMKFVRETFREDQKASFKRDNPGPNEIIEELIQRYSPPSRFRKAVQRLRDEGRLLGDVRDIGPLLGELGRDLKEERAEEIKDALFRWAWKKKNLSQRTHRAFPAWYKQELAGLNTEEEE